MNYSVPMAMGQQPVQSQQQQIALVNAPPSNFGTRPIPKVKYSAKSLSIVKW